MTFSTDYQAVYAAWCKFRIGKKVTQTIDTFAYALEANIARLSYDLKQQTYKHGDYQRLVVHEKKRRDLAVASVRDRVVHRLVYDYLTTFDHRFDPDTWSCRKGKGLHKCLDRIQSLFRKYPASFVWRGDLTKFFDTVNHQVLIDSLKQHVQEPSASWLCQEVIGSYAVNRTEQNRTEQNRTEQNRTEQNRHTYWQSDQPSFCQYISQRV